MYFLKIATCKYHENYVYDSVKTKTERFLAFKMKITQDNSHQYISLNQKDERLFFKKNLDHPYSYAKMFVGKLTEDGIQFVSGAFKQDKVITVESIFEKGDYIILVDIIWWQDYYRDLILSMNKQNKKN